MRTHRTWFAILVSVVLMTAACGSSGGSSPATTAGAGTTSLAPLPTTHLVGFSRDGLAVYDASGANPRTVAVPDGFVPLLSSSMGQWAVENTAASTFRYVDLASGEQRSIDLPAAGLTPVPATVRNGSNEVLLDAPNGGAVVVVDLAAGTAKVLGQPGTTYFPGGARGDSLVFFDPQGVRSLVVPRDEPSAVRELPGIVIAVQGDDALVSVPSGDSSQLSRYHGTEAQGKPVTMLEVGAMLTPTGALVVELDGSVATVDFAAGTATKVGTVDPDTKDVNARAVADDRLFAWGPSGSSLLDPDGKVVASFALVGGQPLAPSISAEYGACIGLQPGDDPLPSGGGALLIDTASGGTLATLDSSALAVSDDGCTALTVGTPSQLVVDRRPVDVGLTTVLAVSPDHAVVVGRGADGKVVLQAIGATSGSPLPTGAYGFARF